MAEAGGGLGGRERYEAYVGRWSRLSPMSSWMDRRPAAALARRRLRHRRAQPASSAAADPARCRRRSFGRVLGARARAARRPRPVRGGDARRLPVEDARFDAASPGLSELRAGPGGGVRGDGPGDQARRSGGRICLGLRRQDGDDPPLLGRRRRPRPGRRPRSTRAALPDLQAGAAGGLFTDAGLAEVEVRPIDVPTRFRDFDDYWTPFLGGQGPAPGYAVSLDEQRRAALRELLGPAAGRARRVDPRWSPGRGPPAASPGRAPAPEVEAPWTA